MCERYPRHQHRHRSSSWKIIPIFFSPFNNYAKGLDVTRYRAMIESSGGNSILSSPTLLHFIVYLAKEGLAQKGASSRRRVSNTNVARWEFLKRYGRTAETRGHFPVLCGGRSSPLLPPPSPSLPHTDHSIPSWRGKVLGSERLCFRGKCHGDC